VGARAQQADTTPTANPARPTVTNPATLPPVGYVQFENGYLASLGSPDTVSQYGVNQVTKLAVHPRLMLVFGSQPFAASTLPGVVGTSKDAGAISLGVQAVLFTPTPPTPKTGTGDAKSAVDAGQVPPAAKTPVPVVSIGFQHVVYGGTASDVDLGSTTNTLLLFFSGDVGNFHYDSNALFSEQDGTSSLPGSSHDIRRAQFGQTLSVNHPFLFKNTQISVELYHFTQPLVDVASNGAPASRAHLFDILVAPSYQPRNNIVIDFGFSHGFTATSTQWQSFVGFTYVLPKKIPFLH
jgi:hypothetical protein